ncbi:hypothetical protein HYE03_00865 [Mycoplasmopsis bovis]|nr:hypothetical protein [Mycoplasmopsis bovis]QQH27981.1 hypothetical protein HYE03_00865 [Mycoplasmopsis bovis]
MTIWKTNLIIDKAGLLKSYYDKNNYNEIEKYIKSWKNNKEFKDKMSYIINFNGTSNLMMITESFANKSKLQKNYNMKMLN